MKGRLKLCFRKLISLLQLITLKPIIPRMGVNHDHFFNSCIEADLYSGDVHLGPVVEGHVDRNTVKI